MAAEGTPATTTFTGSGEVTDTTPGEGLSTGAIIGIAVGCGAVALIIIVTLIYFLVKKVQYKRSGEGKYSPSASENKSGVRMDDMMTVMQPPPPERLI